VSVEAPEGWNLDSDPLWKNAVYELNSDNYDAVVTVFDTDLDKYRVRRRRDSWGREKVKDRYFEGIDPAVEYMTALTNLYGGRADNMEELSSWLFDDSG
jgi:hypothetical protein